MISIPRIEKIARGDKTVTPRDAVEEKFAEQGGGSGGYDPYIIEITATVEEGAAEPNFSTDAVFEDAKAQFLANKPVLMRMSTVAGDKQDVLTTTYILQVILLATPGAKGKEYLSAIVRNGKALNFWSDGSITAS